MSERFRTIVADPPWRYRNTRGTQTRSRAGRGAVTAEHNYPTMDRDEVAALPVADMAADSAHVYLWVTVPLMFELRPVEILEAWGFRYVTLLTWEKTGAPGMGFSWRGHTEHVLFGVRGSAPIPASDRQPNIFAAPRRGHSEKPDLFYDLVEQVSPEPRLELFARRARFGWDYWGDESLQTMELAA